MNKKMWLLLQSFLFVACSNAEYKSLMGSGYEASGRPVVPGNQCETYRNRERAELDKVREIFKTPNAKNAEWVMNADSSLNTLYRTILSKFTVCSKDMRFKSDLSMKHALQPYNDYAKKYESITGEKHVPSMGM